MSSLNAPPADERSFFERLADSWYGQQGNDVGSYADFWRSFIQTNPSRAQELLGPNWNADQPSQLSGFSNFPLVGRFVTPSDEAIGYIRMNTGPGNETKDAIFTVLANQLGVDNAIRASIAREEGDYGTWAKELATGAIEAYITVRSTAGQVLTRGLTKGAGGLINAFRRAPVTTVRAAGPTVYNFPGRAGSIAGVGPSTPLAYSTARTGARGFTTLPGRALDATGDLITRFGNAGWGGTAKAVGRRLSPSRLPGGRFGALLGLLGAGMTASAMRPGSQPSPTATENRGGTTPGTSPIGPVVSRESEAESVAATQARMDVAGINQQYNNILRELRGMYQLSETEEEKERLRFMLADIEAQRDAGLQAISEGYAQTVGQIREQAVLSGERTTERSQRYGEDLEAAADRAAQRMMLQNLQQQQQFRGLGSGSQAPVNEWVGLMSAMAPAQQLYTQRMGDISREGMEWLANTVGAQGQAQAADLVRQAAATRSGVTANQQQQVGNRINRERELQNAAILDILGSQASAVQAAQRFNASQGASVSPLDRANTIQELSISGFSPEYIQQYFATSGLGSLDPSELALAQAGIASIPTVTDVG